ncbi:MAG: MFS transporter [Candidatus Helarchaeota archaeon]|nr:MFS transporter [Candidatus Helarchaeota archaeon]
MTELVAKNIRKAYIFRLCVSLHFIGGVIVPFFLVWGGITFTQIMLLQAWFMLWIFIFEIPTGTIADYLGRKYSLVLACIVHVIAVLIYSSVPNFFIFMIGEFFWALAEALISGAGHAFVYDSLKTIEETGKSKLIFGRFESFALIGYMLGSVGGSIMAATLGLRSTMLFMSFSFGGALIVALTFQEPPSSQDQDERRKTYMGILKDGVKVFYRSKILKILAFDMIAIGTISFLMFWLYQPMLLQLNIDIIYFGIIHAIWVGGEIIIMNSYERLEKLLRSKKRYLFFSAFIAGIMFIIGGIGLAFASIPLMIISIVLLASFGFSRYPLLLNYLNKHIPSPERATVLSTINMFQTLCLVIIYPLIGLMEEWSLVNTLIILGIAGVIFSVISRVKEEYLID